MKSVNIKNLKLSQITADPSQPRKTFNEESLNELAGSIKKHGVIQPITVQPLEKAYIIVMGERRFRASKIAGKKTIPCIVREFSSDDVREVQIIENLQREDVDTIEEAEAISYLIEKYSPEEISKRIGRSIPFVYQRVKLGQLIEPFKETVRSKKLPLGLAVRVAAFSAEDQNIMADHLGNDFMEWQVKSLISDTTFDLVSAPFNLDDEYLLPKAGACSVCPFNTLNNGDLFGEGKAICTKGNCFQAKKTKSFLKLVKEAKVTGDIIIPDVNSWNIADSKNQEIIKIMESHKFKVFCSYQVSYLKEPDKPTFEEIIRDNFVDYNDEEDGEEANQDFADAMETYEIDFKEWEEAKENGFVNGKLFNTTNYTTTDVLVQLPEEGEEAEINSSTVPVSQKKMDECTPDEQIIKIKDREKRKKEIEGGREFEEIVTSVRTNGYLDKEEDVSEGEIIAFCITAIQTNIGWHGKDIFKNEAFYSKNTKSNNYFEEFKKDYHQGIFNKVLRYFILNQVSLGESTADSSNGNNGFYHAVKDYYKTEIDLIKQAYKKREEAREAKMQKRIDELEEKVKVLQVD
jgi:ParB family chromosome partitioning protein